MFKMQRLTAHFTKSLCGIIARNNNQALKSPFPDSNAGYKNIVRHKSRAFKMWPTPKLPFTYVYPEKVNHMFESGDIDQTIGEIDYSQPKHLFETSEELKDANEHVQRLFSLEMAPRKEIVQLKKLELVSRVQRHYLDTDSEEVRIAQLTMTIRSMQEHMRKYMYDKNCKRILIEVIGKRNKRLRLLRKAHMEKFNWLVKELGIIYKRPLLAVEEVKPTRRNELRRITSEYCNNIRNTRLNTLHEKLKAQQEPFLKEKEEFMKFVEKEEKELGVIDSK